MPLSKKGNKMLNILIKEYGKKRGCNIFYALENKHPDWVRRLRKRK